MSVRLWSSNEIYWDVERGDDMPDEFVEKSAYESLKAERDKLLTENEKHRWRLAGAQVDPTPVAYESLKAAYDELISYMPKVPTQPYEREMAQEIARLKEALAESEKELSGLAWSPRKDTDCGQYVAMPVEREQELRAQLTIATEALEQIASETLSCAALAREALDKLKPSESAKYCEHSGVELTKHKEEHNKPKE